MLKFYIVFTIEHHNNGNNSFIMENVFPSREMATEHKLDLEFKYNTEYYPNKDKIKWEKEYKSLKSYFYYELYEYLSESEDFKKISTDFITLSDRFAQNEIDNTLHDSPFFRSYVKEITVEDKDR